MKKPKKNKPQSMPPAKAGSDGTRPTAAGGVESPIVRETSGEPVAERAAVPVLLIALLGALVYFGDMYVVDHGGELDARVHQPFRSVKELDDLQIKAAVDPRITLGFTVYKAKNICAPCHQDDGNGNPGTFIPPLAGSEWVAAKDPARIIRIVLNGLQGPVTVKGKTWGQAAMLPWRDTLSDDEVAAVLSYVRNSWGNSGPMVEAADVKKIRAETADKGGNWTVQELLGISLKE